MLDLTGQIIKGYELHERLGTGGFGAVYKAAQAAVGRDVSIKIILPDLANQPDFIRLFLLFCVRQEAAQSLLVGVANARLGDETGDKARGRHVEARIGGARSRRSDLDRRHAPVGQASGHGRDFAFVAFLAWVFTLSVVLVQNDTSGHVAAPRIAPLG